ncbi:MAG: CopL family metal-binding regulatory protein [Arenimonas sp.]
MPVSKRQRSHKKLPILLLVFLLCVQSIGYAAHGLNVKMPDQTQVAEQEMPPCHDMPDMRVSDTSDLEHGMPSMPCCDDGDCADSDCMMPPGTHFQVRVQTFFIPVSRHVFIANMRGIDSIKPSPPIRPPIA